MIILGVCEVERVGLGGELFSLEELVVIKESSFLVQSLGNVDALRVGAKNVAGKEQC